MQRHGATAPILFIHSWGTLRAIGAGEMGIPVVPAIANIAEHLYRTAVLFVIHIVRTWGKDERPVSGKHAGRKHERLRCLCKTKRYSLLVFPFSHRH